MIRILSWRSCKDRIFVKRASKRREYKLAIDFVTGECYIIIKHKNGIETKRRLKIGVMSDG